MALRLMLFVVMVAAVPAFAQKVSGLPPVGEVDQLIAIRRPLPAPPPGEGWVWVPPAYRTVYEWVWQEGRWETITQSVWVPDQYGWRTVCVPEGGQLIERQEWVVLVPGHYETRSSQVWNPQGGWVRVGRTELVTPGHWEFMGGVRPPVPGPLPMPQPRPREPGLEPFSPLWEWPENSKPEGSGKR